MARLFRTSQQLWPGRHLPEYADHLLLLKIDADIVKPTSSYIPKWWKAGIAGDIGIIPSTCVLGNGIDQ